MKNTQINDRLGALRAWMRDRLISAFVFPSTDPHHGEYVPDHWKGREWISGFNGSAGTAVVTLHEAALWTDSRYFIAATQQLDGTEFVLMKERVAGTPTVAAWLAQVLGTEGPARVGVDGMVLSAAEADDLRRSLAAEGPFALVTDADPLDEIWTDRPAVPLHPVEVHPLCYAGETAGAKLERIRTRLGELHADGMLVCSLDDIAWTLNLRGSDVHCNPVFVAYLLIAPGRTVLFTDRRKVDGEVLRYLDGIGVELMDYEAVKAELACYDGEAQLMDPAEVNEVLFRTAEEKAMAAASPVPGMKSVKNATEIEGFRQAMLRDGIAMVRFLHWLLPAVEAGGQTEMTVDRKLTALRAEQPLFKGLSFDTIAAYAEHGAIVHYEATPETDVPLKPEGLLLLDSGAQYLDGTTDITRTIALGPLTEEERQVYTTVLKAHIQLELLKFPSGASGTQLDAVARKELWREGLNYLHGTGHGVGAYLNVHEGPHQIRMEYKPAPMVEGLTVTDEPGVYVEGRFGVRIENTLLVPPYINNDFGTFLQFESLTLCPIDLTPVDLGRLTDEEISWLNGYHHMVYEQLEPHLDDDVRQWLRKNTLPVAK